MAKRFHLECPFDEKDMCKSIGGRWDMDERKWYVSAELDPDQFRRWWPADASASKTHLTIVPKNNSQTMLGGDLMPSPKESD